MKFNVTKTSDWNYRKQVELNSLKKLLDFCEDNGGEIIIKVKRIDGECLSSIEIYDDWRE